MTRRLTSIFAALSALILAGCTAKDILVTKPVSLGLKIDYVSGSKVTFSVTAEKQDATYIIFTAGEGETAFNTSEPDAAKDHLSYLEALYEKRGAKGTFTDFACFKGSREHELKFLSQDTEYKLFLFQIHPKTRQILGDIHVEHFHTDYVEMKPLDFDFSLRDNTLIIEPSDGDRTYIWGYERVSRILDDYDNDVFAYLYSLIDMYENYGFIDHRICRGDDFWYIGDQHLREGEPYVVAAIGYEDGEINSEISYSYFVLRNKDTYFVIN